MMEFHLGRPFPAASLVDESRYDFFHNIHKALRLGHCRMLAALGAHDFTDCDRTMELLADLKAMLALARLHLDAENHVILPALGEHRPSFSARTFSDHKEHEQAFAELESLIRSVEVATERRRNRAGHTLYRHYALFAAADIQHMNEEETELLTQLHQAFSDAELKDLEARMMAAIDSQSFSAYLKLMMPALNRPEMVDLLSQLKAEMPDHGFGDVARKCLVPVLGEEGFAEVMAEVERRMGEPTSRSPRLTTHSFLRRSGDGETAPHLF